MRILIPTIGTRGDIQPYIALGQGFIKDGHQVTIASHPLFRGLVESYGLDFGSIGPDIDLGIETARIRGNARSLDGGFLRVMRFSFDMLDQSHADILHLAEKTDRIVVSHSAAGSIEADQLGIPYASATLFPQAIPANDPNQSIIYRLVSKAIGAAMGLVMTRPLDNIRRKYGLAKMGPNGITSPVLNLIAVSPVVVPPNPLWEQRHRMTGYWYTNQPTDWVPDVELERFLESGSKPVVISLGAMSLAGYDTEIITGIILKAIELAGVRAVIQGWQDTLQRLDTPASVFSCGSVPHTWLLPRVAALVHHGGFGTTAAGLHAGIPQVVIPFIIDQFMWGNLSAEKGFGVKPIPRKNLTPERLAAAIRTCMDSEELRQRAVLLGEMIRKEDGVTNAVQWFQQLLG